MFSIIATVTLLANILTASAVPTVIKRTTTIDDKAIMNFALTLEHLENAFYTEGLSKYDDKAFTDAGLPAGTYGRMVQLAQHEKDHVEFLTAALGDEATKPCTYDFPYKDPVSFMALSAIFEGVGAGAYTGAAHYLKNEGVITAAASILATEARQAAWVSSTLKGSPWSESYETPLTLSEAFNLGAPFIKSCPSTNPVLPVKKFKSLTLDSTTPGQTTTVKVDGEPCADNTWVAFLHGSKVDFVQVVDNSVTIPSTLFGTVYAVLTSSNKAVNDDTTIAGVQLLAIGLSADTKVPSSN
jgi:hypothetical protein